MGRRSTGAITVDACLQLRIEQFAKIIKEGNCNKQYSIQWERGASISFTLKDTNGQFMVEFKYQKTEVGVKVLINYLVLLVGKTSNLGRGTIYYFVCPFNVRCCKVLYLGYGSRYFKSREAYSKRIYYPSQLSSHLNRHNDAYFRLERQLARLYPEHPKSHYKGHQTRSRKRLDKLGKTKENHDYMRWRVISVVLKKSLGLDRDNDISEVF